MNRYIINRNGQTVGEFSSDEIKDKLHSGQFGYDDFAFTEGYDEWKEIGSIPEFSSTEIIPPAVSINAPSPPVQAVAGYRSPEEVDAIERFNRASKEKEEAASRANWWAGTAAGCVGNTAGLIALISTSMGLFVLGILTFPFGSLCCLLIPVLWALAILWPQKYSK